MSLLSMYRGIEGHPFIRVLRLGGEAGVAVGSYLGEKRAEQIQAEGASSGPVFSQEMFNYEISAIRMGAQI